jgi:hypothetical protein
MNNAELWESYREYTNILSNISRRLGFAAAAICWFFKTPDNKFPHKITFALIFTVVFFVADIMQYLLGAIFLRVWTRVEEKRKWRNTGKIEGEYHKPYWLDYPSYFMWWIKVLAILVAFILIGIYLFKIQN